MLRGLLLLRGLLSRRLLPHLLPLWGLLLRSLLLLLRSRFGVLPLRGLHFRFRCDGGLNACRLRLDPRLGPRPDGFSHRCGLYLFPGGLSLHQVLQGLRHNLGAVHHLGGQLLNGLGNFDRRRLRQLKFLSIAELCLLLRQHMCDPHRGQQHCNRGDQNLRLSKSAIPARGEEHSRKMPVRIKRHDLHREKVTAFRVEANHSLDQVFVLPDRGIVPGLPIHKLASLVDFVLVLVVVFRSVHFPGGADR